MLMKYDCFPRFLKSEFNRCTPTTYDFDDECENKERKRKVIGYFPRFSPCRKGCFKSSITVVSLDVSPLQGL